jgi:hypothetical protein
LCLNDFFIHVKLYSWYLILYLLLEDAGNEIIVKADTTSMEVMDNSCISEELERKGQLCRLCASSISKGIYIFSGVGREQHLADKINTCLPVTVSI